MNSSTDPKTERSLRASSEILKKANAFLREQEYTPTRLADDLRLDILLVSKFFQGEAVDQQTFLKVCKKLEIDLRRTEPKQATNIVVKDNPTGDDRNLSSLVKQVKEQIKHSVQGRFDRLRVLDMAQPICLSSVYVSLNFWKSIPAHDRHEIAELNAGIDRSERFSWMKTERPTLPSIEVIEKNSRLLIFGKPGAGKTSLLKHLAFQCITDEFQAERVPLLIDLCGLPAPSDLDLFDYIARQFSAYGIDDPEITKQLLSQGKVLLLLDRWDAIEAVDRCKVAIQVSDFVDRYPHNRYVISCRTGVSVNELESFSIVEIADLNSEQIQLFAQKWFAATGKIQKNNRFHKKLGHIAELATNPLMLTAICQLVDVSNFYNVVVKEAFNLMLQRREQGNSLSLTSTKELLSDLAKTTYESDRFFFEQQQLEQHIHRYIQPHAWQNLNGQPDEIDILGSLKQQGILVERAKHIYSFSYLVIQEYLIARKVAIGDDSEIASFICDRITQTHWYRAIRFVFDPLQQADGLLLLMKQKIDGMLAKEEKLQKFLVWIQQQSQYLKAPYKQCALRAFYLDIDLDNARVLDRARAVDLAHTRSLERAQARALGQEQETSTSIDLDFTLTLALNLDLAFFFSKNYILELARTIEPDLDHLLWQLSNEIPDPFGDRKVFSKWWQASGMEWSKNLRNAFIHHRKVTQDWEFSSEQEELLRQYSKANMLLIECLQTSSRVSPAVRAEIESTLLLPVDDL